MKKSIFGNYTSTIDRLLGIQARPEHVIEGNNAPPIAAPAIPEEAAAPAEPMAAPLAEPVAPAPPLVPGALEVDLGPYDEEDEEEEADLEQEEEEADGAEAYEDNDDDDDDDYDDDDAEQVNDKHDKDKDNDGKGTGGGGTNGASGGGDTDFGGPSGGNKGSGGSSGSNKTNNDEPSDSTKYDVNKFASYNYTEYSIADAEPIFLLNDMVLKIADDMIRELPSLSEMHCSGAVVSSGVVVVSGSY